MTNQERLAHAESIARAMIQRLHDECGVLLVAIIRTEQLNDGMAQSRAEVGYRLDPAWQPTELVAELMPDSD